MRTAAGRADEQLRPRGDARFARGPPPNRTRTPRSANVTPELATAVVLVAVMVVVAIIVRNMRDRSSRQEAHRAGQTAALGAATLDADLVQRRLEGRPAPVGPTRIVVAGQRPPVAGLAAAAAGVDDPEPPRVQLIRDASAVGIAIIVVLLIGPMIFASRTGAVLGETSPPEGAVAPSGELGPSPAAEEIGRAHV